MSLDFNRLRRLETEVIRRKSSSAVLRRTEASTPPPAEYLAVPIHGSSVWEFLRTLYQHKLLILLVTLLTGAVATLWSFLVTPVYEARGTISIGRSSDSALGLKDTERADWDEADVVELDTQVDILKSDTLARQVIKALNLQHAPGFIKEGTRRNDDGQEMALEKFKKHLEVSRLPRSRIVEVRFRSPDPQLSANVVNAMASMYIEHNYKSKFQSNKWIAQQIDELRKSLEGSQEKLVAYQRANGVFGFDDKSNIVTSALDQLNREYTASIAERIQKEANYRLAVAGSPELLEKADAGSLLPKLEAQKADITAQIAERKTLLGPAHPKMRALTAQLRDIESSIQGETTRISRKFAKEYATAREREQMLRKSVEDHKTQANELSEKAIEYNILKHDVDANRQLYDLLLAKLKEAGVAAGLKSGNIAIVDMAQPASYPSSPRKGRNILTALSMGLMGGIVLALVLEKIDCRVRNPEDVEALMDLPCLGFIPSMRIGKGGAPLHLMSEPDISSVLAAYNQPYSPIAESFRALRTRLSHSGAAYSPRVILVTSPLPQDGKTLTCLNLAVVLAQAGRQVVLVDCDLRMSGLSNVLLLGGLERGLSTVLTGKTDLPDIMAGIQGLPGLQIVPAGPNMGNPAELLNSREMGNVIQRLRRSYDDVILDSPPALSVTDGFILSALADMTILVARVRATLVNALLKTRNLFAAINAPLAGIVVNNVTADLSERLYYGSRTSTYYNQERRNLPPSQ